MLETKITSTMKRPSIKGDWLGSMAKSDRSNALDVVKAPGKLLVQRGAQRVAFYDINGGVRLGGRDSAILIEDVLQSAQSSGPIVPYQVRSIHRVNGRRRTHGVRKRGRLTADSFAYGH